MQTFRLSPTRPCLLFAMLVAFNSFARGQETYGPTDPICAIDGEPIFLGELNLLLRENLNAKNLSAVDRNVQRAAAALLVRRHLAMDTLRDQGGESLQNLLDRAWSAQQEQLQRSGQQLEDYCRERMTDPTSLRRARDWQTAWRTYLKGRMTDANLKRFYEMNRQRYAPTRHRVSHLFLSVDQDDSDAEAIAEQRLDRILQALETAASENGLETKFAELARTESDGATAAEGGSLGWVSGAGDLPAAVMTAIGKTPPGSVSPTVRSPLGFHLVLVHERSPVDIPFEQLEDVGPLRRDAADAMFQALVDRQDDRRVVWFIKGLKPPGG